MTSTTTIIKRTGQAPLRIRGAQLAHAETSMNNADPSYSGSPGNSADVTIYRTAAGRHVVAIAHLTIWQGCHDTDEAAVFPTLPECIQYLQGRVPGWLVEDIIEQLGPDNVAEEVA